MRCPGCDFETRSVVRMCLQCGWQAPDLAEALGPRPPLTGIHRKIVAGLALIALAIAMSVATLVLAVSRGGGVWVVFAGGVVSGLFLILQGIADQRNGRG